MIQRYPLKIYENPEFKSPSLIVCWRQDAGMLSPGVMRFLKNRLHAEVFCEIEPLFFSSFGGVSVEDDIIQYPESKFYYCEQKNVVLFESNAPAHDHYEFLAAVLRVAQRFCNVKELFTIGAIVSLKSHTTPSQVLAVVNRPELKQTLVGYGVDLNANYKTPHGGRPTLSSYLLWLARKRSIAGISLWGEVPFYLSAADDPRSCKRMLEFLNERLGLGLDIMALDLEIKNQDCRIEELSNQNPEIVKYINMLERGIMLSESESEDLVETITSFLKEG